MQIILSKLDSEIGKNCLFLPHDFVMALSTVDDPDVKYSAVSGFVFLRFFAPAILSPTLFHLRTDNPVSLKAARGLQGLA